jgi:hypothetical protein
MHVILAVGEAKMHAFLLNRSLAVEKKIFATLFRQYFIISVVLTGVGCICRELGIHMLKMVSNTDSELAQMCSRCAASMSEINFLHKLVHMFRLLFSVLFCSLLLKISSALHSRHQGQRQKERKAWAGLS